MTFCINIAVEGLPDSPNIAMKSPGHHPVKVNMIRVKCRDVPNLSSRKGAWMCSGFGAKEKLHTSTEPPVVSAPLEVRKETEFRKRTV